MKYQFMFSGIGGQGVISIGELICTAAMKGGYTVTFTPFYGQEKRGGRTMCQMVVSEGIGSPIISEADVLLVMDERSLRDYERIVKTGGCLIVNTNLIEAKPARTDIQTVFAPINDMARNLGNAKIANMVALGIVLQHLTFIDLDSVKAELKSIFFGEKEKLIPINEKALEVGYHYSQEK